MHGDIRKDFDAKDKAFRKSGKVGLWKEPCLHRRGNVSAGVNRWQGHVREKTMNTSEKTIGEIVADDYRTARVFENHKLDFCCGGKVALAAACKTKGIELATITR